MRQSIDDLLNLALELEDARLTGYADDLRRIVHNMYGEMQANLIRAGDTYDDLTAGMVKIEERYNEISRSL